jgi:3-dehydroquinate dehydratase
MAEKSVADFIVQMRESEFSGADGLAVELKNLPLEERTEENFRKMICVTQLPCMFINYRNCVVYGNDDEARQRELLLAAECGAEVIDVMGDLYDPSEFELTRNPEAVRKQVALIDRIHSLGSKVIMSSHMKCYRSPEEILEHMQRQSERGADILKLVHHVNTPDELAGAMRTTMMLHEKLDKPFVHLCSGTYSRPHRFMTATLGSSIVFGINEYRPFALMGQPTIRAYRKVLDNFHWQISAVK